MEIELDLKAVKIMFNLEEVETSKLRDLQDSIIEEIKSRDNPRTAAVIKEFKEMDICDSYLFITHIPDSVTVEELKKLLERAGFKFGDDFMKWKNYEVIIGLKNTNEDIKEAFLSNNVLTLSYDELLKKTIIRETIN